MHQEKGKNQVGRQSGDSAEWQQVKDVWITDFFILNLLRVFCSEQSYIQNRPHSAESPLRPLPKNESKKLPGKAHI